MVILRPNFERGKNTMKRKLTKIVATISDRRCDVDFIKRLYDEGVNVVRLNTAHQSHADTLKVIENVRKVSDKIALLLDTKGPEIRTTESQLEIPVKGGDIIKIKGEPSQATTPDMICVTYPDFVADVPVGSCILIDDGSVEMTVVDKNDQFLACEVKNEGVIEGKKSVNIPSVHIKLPALSQKDKEYIKFAVENGIDFIAHSFVRSKNDVLAVQQILDEYHSEIKIIAKIENQDGVDNIDEILDVAYGVMVARGDLAIEVPREKIPGIQKMLIDKCATRRKPVIVATQMLHSMIKNPSPTRAEVTDIATAIYEGTDAIMLSGETAYGKYPVEAVQTMSRIALEVESQNDAYRDRDITVLTNKVAAMLIKYSVKSATQLNAKAIVADTTSGRTVRNLTGFRGNVPIFALCYRESTMRELALSFGVFCQMVQRRDNTDDFLKENLSNMIQGGLLASDDLIVILAGSFGRCRAANFIRIIEAGELNNQ